MDKNSSKIHSLFKTCIDIMRNDSNYIVGDEALIELSHFLILRLIEPLIDNNIIDINDLSYYPFYPSLKPEEKEHFKIVLGWIKFHNLVNHINEKEDNSFELKTNLNDLLWNR